MSALWAQGCDPREALSRSAVSTLIVLKCSIGECKTLGTSVARVPALTIWHEITGKHVVALLPVALEKSKGNGYR